MTLRCWLFGHKPTEGLIQPRMLEKARRGYRCERCGKPLLHMGLVPKTGAYSGDDT